MRRFVATGVVCISVCASARGELEIWHTATQLSGDIAAYDFFARSAPETPDAALRLVSVEGISAPEHRFRFKVDDVTNATLTGPPDGLPDTLDLFNASQPEWFSSVRASPVSAANGFNVRPSVLQVQPHPWAGGRRSFGTQAYGWESDTDTPLQGPTGFQIARIILEGAYPLGEPGPAPTYPLSLSIRVTDDAARTTTLDIGADINHYIPPVGSIVGIPAYTLVDVGAGQTSFSIGGTAVNPDPDATVLPLVGASFPGFMELSREISNPTPFTIGSARPLTLADVGTYSIDLYTSSIYEPFHRFFPSDYATTTTIQIVAEPSTAVAGFLVVALFQVVRSRKTPTLRNTRVRSS